MAEVKYTSYKDKVLHDFAQGIEKANTKIGLIVMTEASKNTPVAIVNGGALRKSTSFKTSGGNGSAPYTPPINSVAIGWFTEYATYVHEGTYKMRARPEIRNAIITKNDVIARLYREALP